MLVASHHTWSFAPGTAHMRGWCEPVRASPTRNCLIAQWATVSFWRHLPETLSWVETSCWNRCGCQASSRVAEVVSWRLNRVNRSLRSSGRVEELFQQSA
jgi:hypothetical protein